MMFPERRVLLYTWATQEFHTIADAVIDDRVHYEARRPKKVWKNTADTFPVAQFCNSGPRVSKDLLLYDWTTV